MVLTRQEKEKEILRLYNQGKTYKEIAEIVRVSVGIIKPVLLRAEKEREKELGMNTQEGDSGGSGDRKTQKPNAFSHALRLFSEGKSPLDVAIELTLSEKVVTNYYRQYLKLSQLHSLYRVYEEIGDDIIHIPKIHRKIKAAGMGVDQAINLIKNANNDLPSLEQKYQKLIRDVNLLKSQKLAEDKALNDLQEQIDASERVLEWLKMSREEEEAKLDKLEKEKIRLKRLVKEIKGNNVEYLRIKKIVEERVTSILFDGKRLLHLSLFSFWESIRTEPQKYIKLINYIKDQSTNTIDPHSIGYNYLSRQRLYPSSFNDIIEDHNSILLADSEKLCDKLRKEWTEKILREYSTRNSSIHDKFLISDEARQQSCCLSSTKLQLPIVGPNNRAFHVRGMNRIFVKTEF
jgi:DNA-binding CsgD family transcriptional regulator